MARIEKSIELDVPAGKAYNQLTQFEQFPQFAPQIREVQQIDDTHVRWREASSGGEGATSKLVDHEFEIIDQIPDQRIAWRSVHGASEVRGEIVFAALGETRVKLTVVVEGEKLGNREVLAQRAEETIQAFKSFIESSERESGAWRGEVHHGKVSTPPAGSDQSAGKSTVQQTAERATEQAGQYGQDLARATGEHFSRAGREVADLTSHLLKSQRAVQASAMEAANAALFPFRSAFHVQPQQWFSSMLNTFEEPLAVMRRFSEEMHSELERLLERNRSLQSGETGNASWVPDVDVSKKDGRLIVSADVPGVAKQDISVNITRDELVIQGKRYAQHEEVDNGQKRIECSYGSFTRTVRLPDEVDAEKAEATLSDGVLQISLPVVARDQSGRSLEIRDRDEGARAKGRQPAERRNAA